MTTANKSQEEVVAPEANETGEVIETENETVSISKKDYDTLNQTLGSLKREVKDLKKSKDDSKSETKETSQKPDDNRLQERLEKTILRQHNVSHPDDVDLAKRTAKKWNMDLEDVLSDDDFKLKLERQQTERDNLTATSKVKGGGGQGQAKNTPEYWIAKGTPPSPSEVPDRKVRAQIVRALMSASKSSKKFYND